MIVAINTGQALDHLGVIGCTVGAGLLFRFHRFGRFCGLLRGFFGGCGIVHPRTRASAAGLLIMFAVLFIAWFFHSSPDGVGNRNICCRVWYLSEISGRRGADPYRIFAPLANSI